MIVRKGAVVLAGGLLLALSAGQFPKIPGADKIRQKISRIPGVDRLPGVAQEPAITTGLADAVTELPFLDDFHPVRLTPLTDLRRTTSGGFVLSHPGTYVFDAGERPS